MGRRGRKLKEKMKIKMRSEDTCMEEKKQEKKEKKKGNERRNIWMKKKTERIKNKIKKCYHNIFIILSQ